MIKKLLALLIVVSLILITTGCGSAAQVATEEEKYIPVNIETVALGTLTNSATLSGKISSDTDVAIFPKEPGKVASVNVKVGTKVDKGTVLFTLEADDIKKRVDQAQGSLTLQEAIYQGTVERIEAAKSSYERTKQSVTDKLADAKATLERTRKLYEAGAIAKVEMDKAEISTKELESNLQSQLDQAALQASDKGLEQAEAQLRQAQVMYSQATDALKNCAVTTPVGGVVSAVNVSLGNMASSAQPAVTITDTTRLYVALTVTENIVNRLAKDKAVKVTVSSVTEQSIEGRLDYISPSADKTQLFPIKVVIDNPDGLIKPGMFAKVELTTDSKDNVVAIKSEAVIIKDGKSVVYVVEGEKALLKEVTTGMEAGTLVEILKGLKPQEKIIVKGQSYVENGSNIKVVGGITP